MYTELMQAGNDSAGTNTTNRGHEIGLSHRTKVMPNQASFPHPEEEGGRVRHHVRAWFHGLVVVLKLVCAFLLGHG